MINSERYQTKEKTKTQTIPNLKYVAYIFYSDKVRFITLTLYSFVCMYFAIWWHRNFYCKYMEFIVNVYS